jgi:outer membrane cobalamin receptor
MRALCVFAAATFTAHALAVDLKTVDLEQLLRMTVVTASKYEQKQSDVAAAVHIITRADIKAFGWRTIEQALASLPGVHVTYDRQYSYLGMRGFGLPGDFNTRVLFAINGNRVNDPIFDGGPVGRVFPLDIDLIERIEFIPGPGGAIYGQNAMFGVVNVITRRGVDIQGAEVMVAAQQPQRLREGRVTWGRLFDNGVDLLVSASGMRAAGEDRWTTFGSSGVSGVAAGLDAERDEEMFVRVARAGWSFELVQGRRRKDDPTASYFSDPLVSGQFETDGYSVAQLTYRHAASSGSEHSARIFAGRQSYRSVLYYGSAYAYPADSAWHGAEASSVFSPAPGHKVMLGLEVQDNSRKDQDALDLADPANDIRIPGSGYRLGLFAQDEFRIGQTLAATLGVRIDRNDSTGTALSPRAALIWHLADETTLKGLYGYAHRAPNAYERDYYDRVALVANHGLRGERIHTVEGVLDHQAGRQSKLRLAVYRWTLHDVIVLGTDPASGLQQYQSGDAITASGLEVSGERTWNAGSHLKASLAYQDVSRSNGGSVPNSPRLLGRLGVTAPFGLPGMRVGYELQSESKRLTNAGVRLGGYALSNLTLSAAFGSGMNLTLNVQNLFDKRYAHPAADSNWQNELQQDGRSLRVQLSYGF